MTSRSPLLADAGGIRIALGVGPADLDDPGQLLAESVEQQTDKIVANLRRILAEGGLEVSDVVAIRVHLANYDRLIERFKRKFSQLELGAPLPNHTIVGVTGLSRGAQVEMDFYLRRGA